MNARRGTFLLDGSNESMDYDLFGLKKNAIREIKRGWHLCYTANS